MQMGWANHPTTQCHAKHQTELRTKYNKTFEDPVHIDIPAGPGQLLLKAVGSITDQGDCGDRDARYCYPRLYASSTENGKVRTVSNERKHTTPYNCLQGCYSRTKRRRELLIRAKSYRSHPFGKHGEPKK